MRAIWKGAVSFGLVNVPIRLYSATENHDVQFRQVHREDGGRIKYQRICSIDGEQVSVRRHRQGLRDRGRRDGGPHRRGLQGLPRPARRRSRSRSSSADQIDPMLLDKSYYLEPDKSAAKPYILLRDALEQADRWPW